MTRTIRTAGALVLAAGVIAGCGGSSSAPIAGPSPFVPPSASASAGTPTCASLVGKTLTRAVESASCTVSGALQITADAPCVHGTMVALGNVAGGYIGKPVKAGNFANWPHCNA